MTQWTGSPQQRGWDHPRHPRYPSNRNETRPHLTHILDQQRGVPLGVPWKEGCHSWFGSHGCLAGCSSRHQQSLQPARSPTLNSFPILYSLPADNKLSIRSPPEHLQLSSLSRTSAWPRASGSIPNCSHMSHLQLFCRHNCPNSRGRLGNWISLCFQIKVLRWQSTEAKEQASYRCEAKATRNGKAAPVITTAFWARKKAAYCPFFFFFSQQNQSYKLKGFFKIIFVLFFFPFFYLGQGGPLHSLLQN